MIERIWHGWTDVEDADEYERLLKDEVFPAVAAEGIDGYHGVRILRRASGDEVEFVTAMQFASVEAIKQFAGDDYESAHVPPEARDLLGRFDDRVHHYELRDHLEP